MKQSVRERKRYEAQELMWDAMEVISDGNVQKATALCHGALGIYPDCVDALSMLAEINSGRSFEYVDAMRKAVDAGRRDLGPNYFAANRGMFWGLIETRPFMRALAQLAFALVDWGAPQAVDEAIAIFEEMLELNPNDNQGVRDWLAGCYLQSKRYDDAATLFDRYPEDWLAAPAWARVLHEYVTGDSDRAGERLAEARERNVHVEEYLTGRKRRPRNRPEMYSPGDENEAICCADMLLEAWRKHPKARDWLKGMRDIKA